MVHFVLHEGVHQGYHRPAIVVGVAGQTVDLQVFTNGNRNRGDGLPKVIWRHTVKQDPKGQETGTWHWPEHVTARLEEMALNEKPAVTTKHSTE